MGSWVSLKLAEELKIAAGFKICSIDYAFSQMTKSALPSKLALTFQLLDDLALEKSLSDYLQGKEQKITHLATHLAEVFHKYYLFGATENKGWQQDLWQKIYDPKPFTYPQEELSIHLFGFPNICPLHFSYFQKAGAFFYQLSPCQEFWSDTLAQKQAAKILEKGSDETLEELLLAGSPFLANFGQLGRNFCSLIEDSFIETQEDYVEVDAKSDLERIQEQMLLNEKHLELKGDSSIQIHSYLTPWQEVEGLYLNLVSYMQKNKINPSDILVMAPDIGLYSPFIKAIFDEKLDFKILDIASHDSPLLFSLLELEAKRWSAPSVMKVVRALAIFSEEELKCISKWIEKAHIRWGYDGNHAQDLIKRRFANSHFADVRGTWKEGLQTHLRSLATDDAIDFQESELLGKLCLLLQNLYETLVEFHDGTQHTMQNWALKIEILDPGIDLERLCEAAPIDKTYPFSIIWPLIKKEVSKEFTSYHSSFLNAITFSSFHTPLPAKVICLLGMNHDAMPRKEKGRFLNLLNSGQTVADEDKYTFLETLLLTKETLFISYLGRSPFDQTILPPSLFVEELGIKAVEVDFPLPKIVTKPLISTFSQSHQEPLQPFVEIKNLLTAIKNPLRPYFEKKLHIKFERDFSSKIDDELQLSPLTFSQIRKEAVKTNPNTVLKKVARQVGLPLGPFNSVAIKQIERDISDLTSTESIDIHAMKVGPYFLSGKIEGMQAEGYYTLEKYNLKSVICHLPNFLLLNVKTWHFARDKTVKTFDFSKELLAKIVHFYGDCENRAVPLYPEWIESILKKDAKKLKKQIEESFHEEVQYILRRGPLQAEEIIEHFSLAVEELYREVYDAL